MAPDADERTLVRVGRVSTAVLMVLARPGWAGVGVAEPISIRNERYAAAHDIPDEHRFVTWEHVFERPKFADATIIATPDDVHYGPCMEALPMGYDVLLEKPISPSEQECRDILTLTQETGPIVVVCHVLRYAPYFVKLRELMLSGAIGRAVSLLHFEPIQHVHMAHSFPGSTRATPRPEAPPGAWTAARLRRSAPTRPSRTIIGIGPGSTSSTSPTTE